MGYRRSLSINDTCRTAESSWAVGQQPGAAMLYAYGAGPTGPLKFTHTFEPENDVSGPRNHELRAHWAGVHKPTGAPQAPEPPAPRWHT